MEYPSETSMKCGRNSTTEKSGRLDAMSDLMHGLGTSFIASVFLIPAWLVLSFWSFWPHSWWHTASVIIIAVLLALLHFSNYRRVRNRLYKLVQNALATYLARVR